MKIYFARTGGFAGISLTVTLDTGELPSEEAEHLCQLIASSSFFDQPAFQKSPTRGADLFWYRVTVEEGDRKKTVEVDDSSVPESFRPLLEYLMTWARTTPQKR